MSSCAVDAVDGASVGNSWIPRIDKGSSVGLGIDFPEVAHATIARSPFL